MLGIARAVSKVLDSLHADAYKRQGMLVRLSTDFEMEYGSMLLRCRIVLSCIDAAIGAVTAQAALVKTADTILWRMT